MATLASSALAFPGHLGEEGHHVDYYAYPKYKFGYGVKDPHTGDNKEQWEERDGDVVKGAYRLHEPDGTILIVEYTADKHSGFNAVVKRLGKAVHPEPVHYHGGGGYGGGYAAGSDYEEEEDNGIHH
ncbi:hypothetical protein J437_LFUL017424 [Ladona fulva]|uniref:Uncharacterized protein n=1 Tax=Ladona fulva TaxID=123851 RepID=A0A8K0KMI0_LADFU|nr:hypothetical protein J437_LFUL017424 [Ladona fulva]